MLKKVIRQELPRTRLLPISTVAEITGLRAELIRGLVGRGEWPSIRIGPRRRIDERFIRQLLDQTIVTNCKRLAAGGVRQ
jgi:hypothetical protein